MENKQLQRFLDFWCPVSGFSTMPYLLNLKISRTLSTNLRMENKQLQCFLDFCCPVSDLAQYGRNTHKYFVINKLQPLLRVPILNKNFARTVPNRYLTESTGLKKVRDEHFIASVPQAACSAILRTPQNILRTP